MTRSRERPEYRQRVREHASNLAKLPSGGDIIGAPMLTRRGFARISAGATLGSIACSRSEPRPANADPLIDQIEVSVIWQGRDTDYTWFHPRPCLVHGRPISKLLMAVQTISGSDVFGPVHWSESTDLGQT